MLLSLGCQIGQGFLYSVPVEADAFALLAGAPVASPRHLSFVLVLGPWLAHGQVLEECRWLAPQRPAAGLRPGPPAAAAVIARHTRSGVQGMAM